MVRRLIPQPKTTTLAIRRCKSLVKKLPTTLHRTKKIKQAKKDAQDDLKKWYDQLIADLKEMHWSHLAVDRQSWEELDLDGKILYHNSLLNRRHDAIYALRPPEELKNCVAAAKRQYYSILRLGAHTDDAKTEEDEEDDDDDEDDGEDQAQHIADLNLTETDWFKTLQPHQSSPLFRRCQQELWIDQLLQHHPEKAQQLLEAARNFVDSAPTPTTDQEKLQWMQNLHSALPRGKLLDQIPQPTDYNGVMNFNSLLAAMNEHAAAEQQRECLQQLAC